MYKNISILMFVFLIVSPLCSFDKSPVYREEIYSDSSSLKGIRQVKIVFMPEFKGDRIQGKWDGKDKVKSFIESKIIKGKVVKQLRNSGIVSELKAGYNADDATDYIIYVMTIIKTKDGWAVTNPQLIFKKHKAMANGKFISEPSSPWMAQSLNARAQDSNLEVKLGDIFEDLTEQFIEAVIL